MMSFYDIKRIIFSAVVLTLSSPAFANDDSVGVNAAIKGDVTISSGEQLAKQAVIKEPVFLGDVVDAAKVSSLQVLLRDSTVFTVGENSVLTIDEFVYDPSNNNNSLVANVQKGMFRFMSGNISKSSSATVTVDTPVASMGVRGTIVEGIVGFEAIDIARRAGILPAQANADVAGATLFVLRGPGEDNTSANRRGEIEVTSAGITKTTDRSGMAIFVPDADSPPSDPFQLPLIDFRVFQATLRTEPTGPNSHEPFNIGISSAPGLTVVCRDGCDCTLMPE